MTAYNHHYLSQFWLRGFSCPSKPNSIWVYDGEKKYASIRSIKRTACLGGYNNVYSDALPDVNAMEQKLSAFESVVAPVLKRTCQLGQFSSETDKYILLEYVGHLMATIPAGRMLA